MGKYTEKPQPGDKVRVVLEGIVDEVVPPACVVTTTDRVRRPVPLSTVEVLERADDPRKDEPGTVRVSPGSAQYVKVETREGVEPWVFLRGGSGASTQFVRMPDGAVVGWPYAAPVTVTPAEVETVTGEDIDRWHEHEATSAPRVFKADGKTGAVEEPPPSVKAVVDNEGDRLRREGDGWIGYGSSGSSGDFGYGAFVKSWVDHTEAMYAPYTEVV